MAKNCAQCDKPEAMPKLQGYLVWLEHMLVACCEKLGVPVPPKPDEGINLLSSGGSGDDKSAGWGNGTWP